MQHAPGSTLHTQQTHMHAPGGITTCNPNSNITDMDRIRYQITLLNFELPYSNASTTAIDVVWYDTCW